MQNEHDDNATDSAKPEMLTYAAPRQPGEEPPERGRRLLDVGLLDVILVVAIGVVLVGLVLPTIPTRNRHRNHNLLACQSNLRQISSAMQHYATEHRGVYPQTLADVVKYTGPAGYCFVCPASSTKHSPGPTTAQVRADLLNPAKQCCSYVFVVPGLKERRLKPGTIVLHELPGNHKNGMTNFAYADGSVRSLDPTEAKWAIAELQAGFNPPRPINSLPPTTAPSSR